MFPVWSRKAFESLLHHPDPKFNGQVMLPSIPDWVFLISMMIQTWSFSHHNKEYREGPQIVFFFQSWSRSLRWWWWRIFPVTEHKLTKPSSPSFLETLNWEAPLLKGSCRLLNGWIVGARRGHRKELFDRCLIEKQIICHLFGWKSRVSSSAILSVF